MQEWFTFVFVVGMRLYLLKRFKQSWRSYMDGYFGTNFSIAIVSNPWSFILSWNQAFTFVLSCIDVNSSSAETCMYHYSFGLIYSVGYKTIHKTGKFKYFNLFDVRRWSWSPEGATMPTNVFCPKYFPLHLKHFFFLELMKFHRARVDSTICLFTMCMRRIMHHW